MVDADDEGFDFAAAMQAQFTQTGPLASSTEARLKAERRAGMTPKQRAKRAKKPASLNFRTTDEIKAMVEAMVKKFGTDKTDVLERAVLKLAKSEGVTLD